MRNEGPICLNTISQHVHTFNTQVIISTPLSNLGLNEVSKDNNIHTTLQNNILCTTYCDRDFLLNDEPIKSNENRIHCPEIKIIVGLIETRSLIDSGASISCMSEKFFLQHHKQFSNLEVFPLSNINIKTATGQKSKQLKKIIFTEISIKDMTYSVQFVIVPSLIRDIILGVDILKQVKAWMDFNSESLIIFNDKLVSPCDEFIKYVQETLVFSHKNQNETKDKILNCHCATKHFNVIEFEDNVQEENCNLIFEENNHNLATELNIGLIESNSQTIQNKIDEIINSLESLNSIQKGQFRNLLLKHTSIFSDKPGLCNRYEYEIILG
jgi:predicted aspartyl protease